MTTKKAPKKASKKAPKKRVVRRRKVSRGKKILPDVIEIKAADQKRILIVERTISTQRATLSDATEVHETAREQQIEAFEALRDTRTSYGALLQRVVKNLGVDLNDADEKWHIDTSEMKISRVKDKAE